MSPLPCPVVVFGGLHADVALDAGMGAALGRLVDTHQIACVADVSDLGSAAVRHGFMTAFTEATLAKTERCTNDVGGDLAGAGRNHSSQLARWLRPQD